MLAYNADASNTANTCFETSRKYCLLSLFSKELFS